MSFSPTDRANIRLYLGMASVFRDFDSRLENAMTAVEQLPDGGVTESLVKSILSKLAILEAKLEASWNCLDAVQAGQNKVDGARAILMLKMEARRFVGRLVSIFSMSAVNHDVFSSAEVAPGSPFATVHPHGGWP